MGAVPGEKHVSWGLQQAPLPLQVVFDKGLGGVGLDDLVENVLGRFFPLVTFVSILKVLLVCTTYQQKILNYIKTV